MFCHHVVTRSTRWAAAGFLALCATASLAADVTISKNDFYSGLADSDSDSGHLKFSEVFGGALTVMGARISAITPAMLLDPRLTETPTISGMALQSALVDEGGTAGATLKSMQLSGGFQLKVDKPNFVSQGGWVTFADLTVDLVSHTVYGKVSGDHGVGALQGVALWTFEGGDTPVNVGRASLALPGEDCSLGCIEVIRLESLTSLRSQSWQLTDSARSVLTQGLALTAGGSTLFTDMVMEGAPTGTFSMGTVPEAGTSMLMSLGLLGLLGLTGLTGLTSLRSKQTRHG